MCNHQRFSTLLQKGTLSPPNSLLLFKNIGEVVLNLLIQTLLVAKSFVNNATHSHLCLLGKGGLNFTFIFNWQQLWNALNKEHFIQSKTTLIFRCALVPRETFSEFKGESTHSKFLFPSLVSHYLSTLFRKAHFPLESKTFRRCSN